MNARSSESLRAFWVWVIAFIFAAGFAGAFYILMLFLSERGPDPEKLSTAIILVEYLRSFYWLVLITAIIAGIWRIALAIRRPNRT
jgi:hypothetical protein